jgi:hypothetical protein
MVNPKNPAMLGFLHFWGSFLRKMPHKLPHIPSEINHELALTQGCPTTTLGLRDFRVQSIEPTSPPALIWRTEHMDEKVQRLEAARGVMVRVVQARDDRSIFIPIVRALERQIENQSDLNDVLARIMNEAA